jgi:UDPglucose 6-dehydrogenase
MLVSSQIPVGSTKYLEGKWPQFDFAHSPENLRVATAVADFANQSRIVVGLRNQQRQALLEALFTPFTRHIIFTDPETAEMVKHALNTFLGLQIAFINEVAKIAKFVGANMETITEGLRTDSRVSPKAPLKAGAPFGGGHLARDIFTLNALANGAGISVPLIAHIDESNEG